MTTSKRYCFLIAGICLFSSQIFADEVKNVFQYFDNNITLSYQQGYAENQADGSAIGINGEVLFDNNIWVNASGMGLLTYSLSNNNRGLENLYQNKSGSSLGLRGGYAFIVDNFNFIPYLGFNYTNLLIAYNQDSIQQFIFENPSYNFSLGINNEYIIIDKTLKLGLDLGITYSTHKAVLPNTPTTLGHIDYNNYIFSITPSLQYNITKQLTIEGYYSLQSYFDGSANPPNVYYPSINVNSANVINNNDIVNIVGLRFGVLF